MNEPTPAARATDPATSHAAAASMEESAVAQRDRILWWLRNSGPSTADRLDAALALRPTSAGRRLPELRDLGLVRMTERMAKTRSGRPANLWAATARDVDVETRQREKAQEETARTDPLVTKLRAMAEERHRPAQEAHTLRVAATRLARL